MDSTEEALLNNGVKYAKRMTIAQYGIHLLIVTAYSAIPFLETVQHRNDPDFEKELPFRMWAPLDPQKTVNYLALWLFQNCMNTFIELTHSNLATDL